MKSTVAQLLQFLWLFAILVLVNVLYGEFRGILMVKFDDGYLHTVKDLADASYILPLILPGTILEHVLRDSTLDYYRSIYQKAKSHEDECFIEGARHMDIETYQMVKDGTHVLSTSPMFCKFILKDICHLLVGNRKLYFIPEEVTSTDMAFFTNWNFPAYLRNVINERFHRMRQGGFAEIWFSFNFRSFERCEEFGANEENALLELKHLNTVFYLYLYLHAISFVVLVLELTFYSFSKRKANYPTA